MRLPFLLSVLLFATAIDSSAQELDSVLDRVQSLRPIVMDEVLWLARCIYSETNLEHEQELVAWVVRNRVETEYRGATYRDVVLEPLQFSAFNRATQRRSFLLGLDQHTESAPWKRALRVAYRVMLAPSADRPFQVDTRHFYSPVSMPNNRQPGWAESGVALSSVALGVDPDRFRFFAGIDELADGSPQSELLTVSDRLKAIDTARERMNAFLGRSSATEEEEETTDAENDPVVISTTWTPRLRFSGRVSRPRRPASGSRQ